jgi:hypothetical protein
VKTQRGIAQVVFNFLPDQTADLAGAIWRVERWAEPRLVAVDEQVLRSEILRSIYPWTAAGRDSGLADDLERGHEISVIAPSEDGYVAVQAFPRNYRCTVCGRIEETSSRTCRCGADSWRQFAFVTYHECGRSDTPWIPRCPTHKQVRVDLPRSAATSDLVFECPVCRRQTSKGFPLLNCECGAGTIKYNVHRAAVVYTSRSTVIVNPPSQARAEALRAAGARDRVLEWILEGMEEADPLAGAPTVDVLVAQLIESGVPEEAARAAAAFAAEKAGGAVGTQTSRRPTLDPAREDVALDAALQLAYATSGGRVRVDDLVVTARPALQARYQHSYPPAITRGGLAAIELLDDFPVLDAVYGYTRGGQRAAESTLRPFRGPGSSLRIHGQLSHTEALLFRLDPVLVARWLSSRGQINTPPTTASEARALILQQAVIPRAGDLVESPTLGSDLLSLIHSYSHRVMRRASAFCGIDRDSLSEYLVPLHLAFAIFASTRGDFVLGGLQALFEHDLDHAMDDIVAGEHRCALDPGCATNGSACVACLHVGEPSCRYFNQFLSRDTLFGDDGYLALAGS